MSDTTINCSNIRELPKPCCIDWLVREDNVSIDDADVKCFRIEGSIDENALKKWALHIRRHYLRDDELKSYVEFFGIDAADHLRKDKIPDVPQIRGGDFAEIIISDLVQFVEGYEVPRYKQYGREDKNSSGHGTDVIAYKLDNPKKPLISDELLAIEVKSRSSSADLKGAIVEAAGDSLKDRSRTAMTLAYYAERSLRAGDTRTSSEMKRFLHASEHPFQEAYAIGAVVGIKDAERHLQGKNAAELLINNKESVFIVHRAHLMELIHEVYNRCTS